VRADLDPPFRALRGVVEPEALLERVRHRLLDVDVLPRFHRVDGDRRVPMVRGRDDDDVDVLVLEELAVV
jgi:hypothetical protein